MWPAFSSDELALCDRVRAFLADALPPRGPIPEDGWIHGFDPAFSRRLGAAGFIGMTWPPAYGGAGRSYVDRAIVTEELLRAGAPTAAHWVGDRQIGPALLAHGTEEQRREIVPRLARGELVFCLGMSEPGAGSDLAALSTRAIDDGDAFVVEGQKVWTSFAHHADYCYLVARTDPEAPRHRGISELLVDMRLPGIRVRPLVDMTGEHHFNEVFFEQVRVPKRWLIGEVNRGWFQIASQLDYERAGMERLLSYAPLLADLEAHVRATGRSADPRVRQQLARFHGEIAVGRQLIYRIAWALSRGVTPTADTALAKLYGSELEQRLARFAGEVLGPYAVLAPGADAPLGGRVARAIVNAPALTIRGGTVEILRTIVAERGLGLPRA
ncbi:MAG: acyl-CoA dehydrogenase family protein [Deltaproteobacteria bacterium]|nr:acyl-CoA dehydrogenase family protein [Deltaproteobacteria bacterium]